MRCIMTSSMLLLVVVALLATATRTKAVDLNSLGQEIYPIDSSWPTVHKEATNLLGDKKALYEDFMDTCREAAGQQSKYSCDGSEDFRVKMNSHQPGSMRNYTKMGFEKIKAPAETFAIIKEFYEANKEKAETEWHSLNTYHNMWQAPPTIVNIQEKLHGGGPDITTKVWESARETLQQWTGMHLSPCSIWGIRIYHSGSILTPHVDRNPLVISAIINVDQDVDEPWPLEVWGRDGKPYNISMEPGEMVLYESHSTIHGRPFPLVGKFYANIFVHFEPLGVYSKEHGDYSPDIEYTPEAMESLELGLPPYIVPGSFWENEWRKANPEGWKLLNKNLSFGARNGDLNIMHNLWIQNPDSIHQLDANGWSAMHEAARAGHVHVAKFLEERGADLNLKTGRGRGQSVLHLALQHHGADSDIYQFLIGSGAEL